MDSTPSTQTSLSFGARIMADMSPAMKKVSIAGFVLIIAAAAMVYFKLPLPTCGLVFVGGSVTIAVANISVKEIQVYQAAPSPAEGIADVLKDIPDDIAQIKAALANNSVPSIAAAVADLLSSNTPTAPAPASTPAPAAAPVPDASTATATVQPDAGQQQGAAPQMSVV